MRNNLRKPCNECPFRRKSIAGRLGPWQPTDIPTHLSFGGNFPCHKTIPAGPNAKPDELRKMEHCAGASIFLNNKIERHRDAEVMAHQELVGRDTEEVFQWTSEFVAYHTRNT